MTRRPSVGWHVATVVESSPETPSARRLVLDVPTWPGNGAGAHLDVRLTAPDGYQATRSYSVASSGPATRVVLAVDAVPDGEISPFLVNEVRAGDQIELHGPLGRYFLWPPGDGDPDSDTGVPVQLVAGGSGVVPLYAIAARHAEVGGGELRLAYSVRTPADAFFAPELTALVGAGRLRLDWVYTRATPAGWSRDAGRVTRALLQENTIPATHRPTVYCCGPTPFVEAVAGWLLELGHAPERILTERFGGS
ncbi:FAD-binding oxidoreductase [Lapillicoccus sp.]|uniref:FAD-binding oxidoreductase n=1 Tax=Lapillicoccus sp. TaxID=1909287 RepID=UPI0025EFD944|nr:FAD-binding oxidoreductase [Lapillicoccus sp.]